MTDIQSALGWARAELGEVENPGLEASILLCHCLQCESVYLHTWPEKKIETSLLDQYRQLVNKRKTGQPVAYLLGYRDFWTLRLQVSPHTLIPRAETELLVEQALGLDLPKNAKVLDLGTGTGAIALALASEKPQWQVTAVDFKSEAVELARQNAVINQLHQVTILQSNWFSALAENKFDLIVSNPPYVETDSPWLKQGDVRFEPSSALTSGKDGLDDIRHIAEASANHLCLNGFILLEHGYQQQSAVHKILENKGFSSIHCIKDLANLDRATIAQYRQAVV
ncbi:peptide chain release factor N(5)-glutamine methyltransferase [Neptunicella sp. SCSIO 80796]|uniref:peptide chain release factor N(5)-glutamine methyltransferase n=1 Tax=Neptunicella plasticusilytica TaxID=3117012 RepID=UPI003A4E1D64